jgi:hypothetical protein
MKQLEQFEDLLREGLCAAVLSIPQGKGEGGPLSPYKKIAPAILSPTPFSSVSYFL